MNPSFHHDRVLWQAQSFVDHVALTTDVFSSVAQQPHYAWKSATLLCPCFSSSFRPSSPMFLGLLSLSYLWLDIQRSSLITAKKGVSLTKTPRSSSVGSKLCCLECNLTGPLGSLSKTAIASSRGPLLFPALGFWLSLQAQIAVLSGGAGRRSYFKMSLISSITNLLPLLLVCLVDIVCGGHSWTGLLIAIFPQQPTQQGSRMVRPPKGGFQSKSPDFHGFLCVLWPAVGSSYQLVSVGSHEQWRLPVLLLGIRGPPETTHMGEA